MKLDKTYVNSEQKYVGKVILYGHTDTYLYADPDHTDGNTVGAAEVLDLCMKGLLLIEDTDVYYVPVSFTGTDEITVTGVSGTASTATFKTYKSKEPTPAEE